MAGGRVVGAIVLALAAVLAAVPASAQPDRVSLAFYEETLLDEISTGERYVEFRRYLRGMATGFEAVMVEYRNREQPLAFCLPAYRRLDAAELQATINWELAARGAVWDQTPGVLLDEFALEALRRRYPCS